MRKFEKLIEEVECHVSGDDSFGVSNDLVPEEAIDAHRHVRTRGVSVVFNKLEGTFKCPTFNKWDRETKESLASAFEDKMHRGFAALVSAPPPAKRSKEDDAEEEDEGEEDEGEGERESKDEGEGDDDDDDEDDENEEDAGEPSAGAGKAAPMAKKAAAKGKPAGTPAAGGAGAAKKAAEGKR